MLPIKIAVGRELSWYLVICLLKRFLNEAQDETWAGSFWQLCKKERNLYKFLKDQVMLYHIDHPKWELLTH